MFSIGSNKKQQESLKDMEVKFAKAKNELDAIQAYTAFIRFDPNGNILNANDNFLTAVAYSLDEVIGKHHRMFCDPSYANSAEYRSFWSDLAKGHAFSGVYERVNKIGNRLFLEANYFPVKNDHG